MRKQEGFTLVELLVVMLILGILAAVAIPSFMNQRGKAVDAAAKTIVRTAQTAMETFATDHNGSYAGVAANGAELRAIEDVLNDAAAGSLAVVSGANTYSITVTSSPSPRTFSVSRAANGSVSRTCALNGAVDRGGCRGGNVW
jgi:type IV pilus assembly protein PilA